MNKLVKFLALTIFVFAFDTNVSAQNINVDSLLIVVRSGKEDTMRVKDFYKLSVGFREYGVFDTALIFANKAIELGKKLNFSKYVLYTYSDMGISYATMGKTKEALEYFLITLKMSKDLDIKHEIGNAYNNIGNVYRLQAKTKEALEAYDQSYKVREQIADTAGMSDYYVNLGVLYYNIGDFSTSQVNNKKALAIRRQMNKKGPIAKLLCNMGNTYLYLGNYQEALKCYYEALPIREEMGNKKGIAECYTGIGAVHLKHGNLDECIVSFKKAMAIYKEINNQQSLSAIYQNLGAVYEERNNFEEALKWFDLSLKIKESISDLSGIALIKENTGIIYDRTGKYDEALANHLEALNIYERLGYKQQIGLAFCNLGSVYFHKKNYKEAETSYQKSIKICDEIGDLEGNREGEKGLCEMYEATGQQAKAYVHYKNYILYRDSLVNEANIKKSVETKMNYEFTKKETEAKLIQDKKDAISAGEKKKQSIIRNSFIVGFCLVFFLAIAIFRSYSNKKKANIVITQQKKEVEQQKHIIEEKNREIIDSINYAKRIQYTLLAHEEFLIQHLDKQFILFKPKDIVSGDFYWATEHNNKFYLAVCDSTGHGVPGAFMSLLSIGFLSEAINEKGIEQPNEVFNYVRERLITNISKEGQQDGFDGVLLCIDKTKKTITYAASNNAPVIVKNNALTELSTDKMPVGLGDKKESFTLNAIEYDPDATIYLYTDGYADQFGGPKGKKFRYKQLEELLVSVSDKNMTTQKEMLDNTIEKWKGDLEQVDDISLLGLKIRF